MYFDAKSDPFAELNDPRILDNTPIGTLRVIPWANTASVAVMHPHDPTRVQRIVRTLHRGANGRIENPLNAVYGKRTHEDANARALYERRDATEAASAEREESDYRGDFRRELGKMLAKRADMEEALAGALGADVDFEDGRHLERGTE